MIKIFLPLFLSLSLFIASKNVHAFSLTGRILLHGELDPYSGDELSRSTNFNSMYHKYKVGKRITSAKANLMDGGEYVLKTGITVGATVVSGGNPVIGAVAGQVAGDALGKVGDSMREGMYDEMHSVLDEGLKRTVLSKSGDYLEKMTGLPKERARKLIIDNPEIFDFGSRKGLDDAEKDLFQEAAIEVLSDKLAAESFNNYFQQLKIDANTEGMEQVKSSMDSHLRNFSAHLKNYKSFSIEVSQRFTTIADSTQKIVKQVTENTINISINRQDINDIQGTLFNDMSGQEKLKALNSGWFSEKGKEWVGEQIELATNQSNIESSLQMVAITAGNLPSAMSLFTSDPKLLDAVNTASQLASGAMSIMAASSMGPFGTAMATLGVMGSMFGNKGGGDKIAAKRHEQIMQKFQSVIDNQVALSNQIGDVHKSLAEGQNEIYKSVQQNAKKLILLGRRIEQIHFQQMRELHLIKSFTLANTDLLRDLSDRDPASCLAMLDKKIGETSRVRVIDQFSNFEELQSFFNGHKDLFKSCWSGLSYILNKNSHDGDIHSMLLKKSYTDEFNSNNLIWATQEVYQPALQLYNKMKGDKAPVAYQDLIHTSALINYVGLVLDIYPIIMLIDDPVELTIINVKNGNKLNHYSIKRAEQLLSNSLVLIDEAILQQEVIAGHHYLNALVQEIGTSEDPNFILEISNILNSNPILKENLVRKIVQDRADKTNSKISYYKSLMDGQQAWPFFTGFFGNRFLPKLIDDVWNLDLQLEHGGTGPVVRLPTPEVVINDRWSYTVDISQLYEMRNSVIDHLSMVKAVIK